MTTDVQLLRAADASADRPRASTGGTGNAFGQLLRSMEQDMWRNAVSALPAGSPATSTPGNTATVESRVGAPDSAEQYTTSITSPLSSQAQATVVPDVRPAVLLAQTSAPAPRPQREDVARHAGGYQALGLGPLPERFGPADAKAPGSTERITVTAPSCNLPASNVSPPSAASPFSVTVLPGNGMPLVSLRIAQADPDDLDLLDSHVRAALLQSGYPASRLVINGIDRNAPGETTHGD
ncbi:TPA: hypothetical protein QDB21_004765 [Burkholderia vietnamiensis]|uniref:hypothetical protein n=1 Tax=Burkholderia vietnamiensis TaxID=60552 RepID=UPI00158B1EEC|nr:hypothetical protein [Burkholderia vietnamiensis]HDR9258767.1 hypothetical protein [Burkholderia vietnamiensis]